MTEQVATQAVPSLLYTDTEDELRRLTRSILDDVSPWTAVVEQLDRPGALSAPLWKALNDAGVCSLLVPEQHGGAGAGPREMAVAMEEVGRAAAPVPVLSSSVIATGVLAAQGVPGADWLRRLASGEIGALVVAMGRSYDHSWAEEFRYQAGSDGIGTVAGTAEAVLGCEAASFFILPAWDGGEAILVVLDAHEAVVSTHSSLDMTRPLSSVTVSDARCLVLARGEAALAAVSQALLLGTTMLASEQLGTAERALELACEHLRTRYQFGRLLGSFQALRHRAADLWTAIAGARAVARYAAACLAEGASDAELAACLAESVCADVALQAAEECLQVMGGIGFTWENPTHLLLKRAAAGLPLLGTPEHHRERIAELRGL